jgi:hypothetical protein
MHKIRQQEAITSKMKKKSRIGKNTKTVAASQSKQELTLIRQLKSEEEYKIVHTCRPVLPTQQQKTSSKNNIDEKDQVELTRPIVPNLPRSMSEIM